MKATGIVRRIDELGRIVVPKEIRRSLGIKEGDPLEFFTNEECGIVLMPYNEGSQVVDNFMKTFKEMNIEDKKAIVKMLVDEMDQGNLVLSLLRFCQVGILNKIPTYFCA